MPGGSVDGVRPERAQRSVQGGCRDKRGRSAAGVRLERARSVPWQKRAGMHLASGPERAGWSVCPECAGMSRCFFRGKDLYRDAFENGLLRFIEINCRVFSSELTTNC